MAITIYFQDPMLTQYVKKYKNHNSILFWELGNEYNYHPEWFDNDISNWYTALNTAAGKIHEIDKSKPVSTAHGEIPDSLSNFFFAKY